MLPFEVQISRFEQARYLHSILEAHATGHTIGTDEEYVELRRLLIEDLGHSNVLPQFVRQCRSLTAFWTHIKAASPTYQGRRVYLHDAFIPLFDHYEFGGDDDSMTASNIPEPSTAPPAESPPSPKKVFVVHGRDEAAKHEAARAITELGLHPIILHEQANSGLTIIEKIEKYAAEADFAIVLYTACDQGRGYHETNRKPYDRARQNVVFEHGYLMAKLGRRNVCPLVKGNIETPNDISGVVYVPMDDLGAWKIQVRRELIECGYQLPQQ